MNRDLKTFRLVRVPGDGDCFFHSLVLGLTRAKRGNPLTTSRARERVAERLREQYGPDSKHARRASTRGRWAHHEEVAAAAHVFGVCIRVWEGANRMWITFGNDKHPRIYLHNARNVHFDLIVPALTKK